MTIEQAKQLGPVAQDVYKRQHWIWYIFPQLKGLGRSAMSEFYGISGMEEARAYLKDPVLGARLIEICNAPVSYTHLDVYKRQDAREFLTVISADTKEY